MTTAATPDPDRSRTPRFDWPTTILGALTGAAWIVGAVGIVDLQDGRAHVIGGAQVLIVIAAVLTVATIYARDKYVRTAYNHRLLIDLNGLLRAVVDEVAQYRGEMTGAVGEELSHFRHGMAGIRTDIDHGIKAVQEYVDKHESRTITRQAVIHTALNRLAERVGKAANQTARGRVSMSVAYRRGEDEGERTQDLKAWPCDDDAPPSNSSNVLRLPNSRSFELGRAFERRKLGLPPEEPETGTDGN